MNSSLSNTTVLQKQIGIASDHAGLELKEYLEKKLTETGYEAIDFD